MKLAALVIAIAILAACDAEETAQANLVAAPLPAGAHEWVELTPQPTLIDGRVIEPTCSGAPGTDPAFRFWARRGLSENLVVFFDGGGACWNDLTCGVPRRASDAADSDGFYKSELLASDNPNELGGMFDFADARNPVADWSFVFVPYCTGDVHSGANTADYVDLDSGESYTIAHRGADNFRVILEWMRANFDAPPQLLVTGSSAGAYGAATHFGRIREAFPEGRAAMLGDAGQGVTTADLFTDRNNTWRYDLPANVFGADAQLTADDDIVADLAAHYPQDRFAQYTTAHDITQASFYSLMGVANACRAWTDKMASDLERRQGVTNFRSYLAAGQSHTILRSPRFYSEASAGGRFVDWFASMLGDGANWDNEACAECLNRRYRCQF